MNVRLEDGAGDRIAGRHDAASTTIFGSSEGAPASVDGGVATPYLADILAAVAGTAGDLGVVAASVAQRVREAAANTTATDAEIAEMFAGGEDGS